MSFSLPLLLILLILSLAVIFNVWFRKGHPVTLPVDYSDADKGQGLGFAVNFASMFPALIFAIVIVILAGPTIKGEPEEEKVLKNILFCLDCSGSMTASFGSKTRYDAAMEAMNNFTSYRKDEGDSFGLTAFGTNFLHWIPITEDTSCLKNSTPFLDPKKMGGVFGGTMLGKALRGCLEVLEKKEEGDKMIILVSDGQSSDDVTGPANELKEAGVIVYSIFIGNGSTPMELYTLANATGGSVFTPNDKGALKKVFKKIDTMQTSKYKKSETRDEDFFLPFSIAGLSLLGLYVLSLFGLRFTPW